MNVLPFPFSLSTSTRPPSLSTIRWVIASPRPVPPAAFPASTCLKGSKISANSSGLIPTPVSTTSKRSQPFGASETRSATPPSAVNFTAFPIRFTSA